MANEQNLTPFQKGNKAGIGYGRPRGESMGKILKKLLDEEIRYNDLHGKSMLKSAQELVAMKLISQAIKGNITAIKEVFDRVDGRVTSVFEIDDLRDKKPEELTDEQLTAFLQEEDK